MKLDRFLAPILGVAATATSLPAFGPLGTPSEADFPRAEVRVEPAPLAGMAIPRARADYDGVVREDRAGLEALLGGESPWRFMAEGEASYYWIGARTANTERYRPDEVSAAILGWFSRSGGFVYLPKAFPRNQGIPLLITYQEGEELRWMFVRWNDRGPYTGPRITPVNTDQVKAFGETSSRPKPDPDRPIDLSRGAMRKLMQSLGKDMAGNGILHGVRIYLPPSEHLPETDPWTGQEGARDSGTTIRRMIDEAYERWPPAQSARAD